MKHEWTVELIYNDKGSYKALMQDNNVIANMDCFSDEFLNTLVYAHNQALQDTANETADKVLNIVKTK